MNERCQRFVFSRVGYDDGGFCAWSFWCWKMVGGKGMWVGCLGREWGFVGGREEFSVRVWEVVMRGSRRLVAAVPYLFLGVVGTAAAYCSFEKMVF